VTMRRDCESLLYDGLTPQRSEPRPMRSSTRISRKAVELAKFTPTYGNSLINTRTWCGRVPDIPRQFRDTTSRALPKAVFPYARGLGWGQKPHARLSRSETQANPRPPFSSLVALGSLIAFFHAAEHVFQNLAICHIRFGLEGFFKEVSVGRSAEKGASNLELLPEGGRGFLL